jgi:hypothetical protein
MTPVEKANELVNKMFNCDKFTNDTDMAMLYPHALQCAIIAVDVILKECHHKITVSHRTGGYNSFEDFNKNLIHIQNELDGYVLLSDGYWNEVKHELEYMYTKQLTK